MSRVQVLFILSVASLALTATSVWASITFRNDTGPAHVLSDWGWSMSIASWLIVAMSVCARTVGTKVDRVDSHVGEVGDVVHDIDKERLQANAVVLQLFRDRKAR